MSDGPWPRPNIWDRRRPDDVDAAPPADLPDWRHMKLWDVDVDDPEAMQQFLRTLKANLEAQR